MTQLQENISTLNAKNNSLSETLDDSREKYEFYKESASRDRTMNQHAQLLLEHCYNSMEDMKRKHHFQLASHQRDSEILVRQITEEKSQVKQLHNQILAYQNELVAKATSHCVDMELQDLKLSVLNGCLMNKFTDIQQGFMPLQLIDMLNTHLKVELSQDIAEVAHNLYVHGIVNIASLKLIQNKLFTKPCIRDEILSSIIKHLQQDGHADCHSIIDEMKTHINAIKNEHDNLSNLAFLRKLDRRDNAMIDFKIPQAYLPDQILQGDPNVINYIQDAVSQKEKLLLKMAKTINGDEAKVKVEEPTAPKWLCAKKRKLPWEETNNSVLPPPPPPPPPPSPSSSIQTTTGALMIQNCCILSPKDKDAGDEMHIPLRAIVDITSEFIQKKKEAVDMVNKLHTPQTDSRLNKMVCLNYNAKFFDSDVHLCDRESDNVDNDSGFANKLCPLEHRCTFVMKCGTRCFSKYHTHVQHAMYWDMSSFDVQRAYDVGAITNNELTQISKLHEEKHRFHHEILSKNLGFCNVSKVVNVESYYFSRKKCNGTVDHGKFHFVDCNSPVWNVIDYICSDDELSEF